MAASRKRADWYVAVMMLTSGSIVNVYMMTQLAGGGRRRP
jgi:hypothetical protein